MFPINYNDPYTKNDGSVVPVGDVIGGGGGGSDLPPHTIADSGKVLTVGNDNNLKWANVSGSSTFTKVAVVPGELNPVINVNEGV